MPPAFARRSPLALALALAFALASAGCVLAPIQERALGKVAEQLPLPPGADSVTLHTGCRGSCLSFGGAFATVHAVYPNGTATNATLLAFALAQGFAGAGWNVTEGTDARVVAHNDAFAATCAVGLEGQLDKTAVDCTVERR